MQPAHPVGARGEADGEGGHVEVAVVGAEGEGLLGLAADLADPGIEVLADELAVEGLVAGGHRGVGGEDGVALRPRPGPRRGCRPSRTRSRARSRPRKATWPSFMCQTEGVDAERAQGAHAADPQHDLLAQAHLAPAHVEDARDRAVRGVVERDVGVEHEHRHQAHLHLPHRRVHDAPGQVDGHGQVAARGGLHRQHGQAGEVVVGVDVLLEAVRVHRLAEVAGAVEQAHPHEGHAEVARGLAVIAGQDPEAAGVDAERLVDPELHREVGDRPRHLGGVLREPQRPAAVLVEGLDDVLVQAHELGVGQEAHPLLGLDVDEELHGVVVAAPRLGVDPREEAVGLGGPAPPVVVGEVTQPLERGRQLDVGDVQGADVHGSGRSSVSGGAADGGDGRWGVIIPRPTPRNA